MVTIRTYDNTAKPTDIPMEYVDYAVVEIVLDDGRTAQMSFRNDGNLTVRAWGNVPGKVGNWDDSRFMCNVQFQEPTTCDKCQGNLGSCRC